MLSRDRARPVSPSPARRSQADGADPANPVVLLSVGRAVAKKGYDDLLAALALLPTELAWRMIHVGGGVQSDGLKQEAARRGLAERIEWRGARPQPEVLAAYREADLFVLAAKIAPDGDRDGLPNVLVEAQSQGLPCISTELSGIPELIEHGVTGILVPPGNREALAAALVRLIGDPALRARLGAAGEARVRSAFDSEIAVEALARRFGIQPAETAVPEHLRQAVMIDAS